MNVRIHFDLITEPWIPVVNGDDTISYLGIWDALQTASKSKGISDASPLVEFGLYRLLSVFLMDALRPEDQFELEDLENAGQFDMAKIQNYIEQCQAEGASFDLFDPERPFLQSPYDKAWDKEKKPVTYLDCRVPTGNNHVHFDHLQESRVFSYAEAARYLPVLPLFVTAGAQGYPSTINAAPPYFTVIKGSNLFETLVHLMLPVDEIDDFDSVPVFWRCNKPVVPKKQVAHTSWLYGMLFPARRVLLIPESDGVREIYYSQGENFCEPGNWTDPHVTYRFGKIGRFPWRPNGAKAVWRNLSDLINIEDQHAPKIMALYRRLHEGSLEASMSASTGYRPAMPVSWIWPITICKFRLLFCKREKRFWWSNVSWVLKKWQKTWQEPCPAMAYQLQRSKKACRAFTSAVRRSSGRFAEANSQWKPWKKIRHRHAGISCYMSLEKRSSSRH